MIDVEPASEAGRPARLYEAARDEHGPIAGRYRIGTLGGHESLDRLFTPTRFLGDALPLHPALLLGPGWFTSASRDLDILKALYQQVGSEHPASPGVADALAKCDRDQGPRT